MLRQIDSRVGVKEGWIGEEKLNGQVRILYENSTSPPVRLLFRTSLLNLDREVFLGLWVPVCEAIDRTVYIVEDVFQPEDERKKVFFWNIYSI